MYMALTAVMCFTNLRFKYDDLSMKAVMERSLLPHIVLGHAEPARILYYISLSTTLTTCCIFLPCLTLLVLVQCQNVMF